MRSHSWDVSPRQARTLQEKLAGQVIRERQSGAVRRVAGVDAGYRDGLARAAVVVLTYPELEMADYAIATRPVTFPYVPGLLTFREAPAVLDAMDKLTTPPDLLIFDGQGIAHPRRLGIASHIGLLLDMPAIGCAKSRLCGQHEEPGIEKGSHVSLIHDGEIIGAVVRTRTRVKPVFVSIGHRIDLAASIEYVLGCCRKYRLPETTRLADHLAGR